MYRNLILYGKDATELFDRSNEDLIMRKNVARHTFLLDFLTNESRVVYNIYSFSEFHSHFHWIYGNLSSRFLRALLLTVRTRNNDKRERW